MKKLLPILFILCCFASCTTEESQTYTYNINEPIFASKKEFRSSIRVSEPKSISNYGKICYYQGFLYISDPGHGIHVVDNTDPANPEIISYIELVGNNDIAIKNDYLYADALIDLVWFDVSNPAEPKLSGRLEEAFRFVLPNTDNQYACDWNAIQINYENSDRIIVGWNVTKRTEKIDTGGGWYQNETSGGNLNIGSGSQGVNGSMSRFGLYDNYLYTVLDNQMSIFDLNTKTPEKAVEDLYIGFNVETIFPYEDNLFMGTPTGLLIYSVENPLEPNYCSMISHVYGCDPVVVENDIAYVTIHSGNFCGQNSNELIIIDVSNVHEPKQLVSYGMTKPKGLGIDNKILFVCDDGLKVFNAKNPQTIMANQLTHQKGMEGYDVIPYNNILMMIADNGLYQYDYSDLNNIKLLSIIPTDK